MPLCTWVSWAWVLYSVIPKFTKLGYQFVLQENSLNLYSLVLEFLVTHTYKLSESPSLPLNLTLTTLTLSISLSLSQSRYHLTLTLPHALNLSLNLALILNLPLALGLALYSPSYSRYVLSLSDYIFNLESQGMSPYLNICLSIGGLGLFVGICRYLWCNFFFSSF